jgi:hypothetical protein
LSAEHFTVDGKLIEARASLASLKRKDGVPPRDRDGGTGMVDFRGEQRGNATASRTLRRPRIALPRSAGKFGERHLRRRNCRRADAPAGTRRDCLRQNSRPTDDAFWSLIWGVANVTYPSILIIYSIPHGGRHVIHDIR